MLVFWVWYPGAFRSLAGGRDLFLLVTTVDVVMGPLLTFAVFDRSKPRKELRRDLVVIAVLQAATLLYGMHTVYEARPVAMVFEVDRFRLVTANSVSLDDLSKAEPPYRTLPIDGPLLLGTRRPRAGDERNDALFQGAAGHDIGSRPQFWQPYEQSKPEALARARPIAALLAAYPDRAGDLRERLASMQADEVRSRFVPALARGAWTAVVDDGGNVLGYLPVDGFI